MTAFVLAACGPEVSNVVAVVPEINYGPAAKTNPKKILSLSSTCGALDSRCTEQLRTAVDNIIRSRLEFAGYSVIDSNNLRLATRQRTEENSTATTTTTTVANSSTLIHPLVFLPLAKSVESASNTVTVTQTDTSYITLTGSNFEDLSVDDRRDVIEKSGADATLSVRIVIGGNVGVWEPNQNIEVSLKLSVKQGDEMAWASRCTVSTQDASTVQSALENAARCAINGPTAK